MNKKPEGIGWGEMVVFLSSERSVARIEQMVIRMVREMLMKKGKQGTLLFWIYIREG